MQFNDCAIKSLHKITWLLQLVRFTKQKLYNIKFLLNSVSVEFYSKWTAINCQVDNV